MNLEKLKSNGAGLATLVNDRAREERAGGLRDYIELLKPRLLTMALLSTSVGFYVALNGGFSILVLLGVVLSTAMVAGGAMALNQCFEHESDAKMSRTQNRPIPAGRLSFGRALIFGLGISLLGFAYLVCGVNWQSALAAGFSWLIYLLVYTPLKKKSSLATFVGAVSGALPPLIGWFAAGGESGVQALVLFLIIFFWQIPHFLAIDWMYRSDYVRAGFATLAVLDPDGRRVARQMNLSALLCVSLLPSVFGVTGMVYFFGAFLLGLSFAWVVIFVLGNLDERARYAFRASVVYLALLLLFMVGDKA